jgi:pantetheine-phosphate adenylyltransferase
MVRAITAVYPGSFDPVTNGHLDIIERACCLFHRVIVAVSIHVDKRPLFSLAERVDMLKEATARWENVEVESFEGLLVNFAAARGAGAVIRGIRAVSDFDYEFQMALMNRRLRQEIETVFLVPAEAYSYLSSSLVKEVASLGGNVSGLIPPEIEQRLYAKLPGKTGSGQGGWGSE